MKKSVLILPVFAVFLLTLVSTPFYSASDVCKLNVSLVNQDPYPVLPGDYVEVVFQVSGTENSACEGARFKIIEDYPFSLDENHSNMREISGSTFVKDYKKSWMVPYRLRVDKNAMDGMNEIKAKYSPQTFKKDVFFSEKFDIKVEDVRADFEIHVKDYNPQSNTITFEILNTGENDVEALTIKIPEQKDLEIKGSPKKIIGLLDSNEETTFDFNINSNSEEIKMNITYTDEIGERRTISKIVDFNPEYYKTQEQNNNFSIWFYVALVLFAIMIFRLIKNRKSRKKNKK